MVAYTMTIPAAWNFQGAVMTGPGCDMDQSMVAYRVWSDDLRYGVQRMPIVAWYTVQDPRTMLGEVQKNAGAHGHRLRQQGHTHLASRRPDRQP